MSGAWYVSSDTGTKMMISGPTLTEAIAALVVAMAHGGRTNPVTWKLSPVYTVKPDEDEVDPDQLTADEWDALSREGFAKCDGDGEEGRERK